MCEIWNLFWDRKQYPGAGADAMKLHGDILGDLEKLKGYMEQGMGCIGFEMVVSEFG